MSGLYILIMIAAVLLIAFALWQSAKRKKELTAWAGQAGLSFSPARDGSFDDRYPAFSCMRRGHSRYAYNIARGSRNGRSVVAFDYRYVTGSGKNRQTHTFSAVIVGSKVPLQPLRIRPENVFDRVTEFFGLDDIDFESAEFSRSFHVKASDKRWAYDVLHQRTMEHLLAAPRFSMQFDDHDVMAWRGRRLSPDMFEAAISAVEGILNGLPEYVVRQQEGGERKS